MEPSCFKRATSRVKRWKGERLRHHGASPVRLANEERREIFTRLYRAGRGPMMIPRRERKLKVADRRLTDIEITSSIKVRSGLIFIVYGSRYGNFGFNIVRETSSKRKFETLIKRYEKILLPKWILNDRDVYIFSPRNHFTLWISINHSYKIIFYKLINCSCIKEVCNIQFNKNIDAILYIYIYIFQNYQTSHYKNTFRMALYYYNVYSYFFFIHFHSSNHFYATIGCDNRIYKSIDISPANLLKQQTIH